MSVSDSQFQDWSDDLSDLDQQIEDLQKAKGDFYKNVREEHGKKTADALKLAVKLNRMDSEKRSAAEEVDAEAFRILQIIQAPRAPRATRVANAVPEHDADTGEIIEPQSALQPADHPDLKQDESDLTIPPSHPGQVAPIQSETANEARDENGHVAGTAAGHGQVDADAETLPAGGENVATDSAHNVDGEGAHNAPATTPPKPMYAAPGVVVEEHAPPEPVKRHPISAAFADLGQDTKELNSAIYRRAGGVAEPIVKIGPVILDGWARYIRARELLIDYPVVQYAGTDLLVDAINWNLASRQLTPQQRGIVFGRLFKLYPDREDEIEAILLGSQVEAAE